MHAQLTDADFFKFQQFIYSSAGIHLHNGKKSLVSGRLGGRVQDLGLSGFADYWALLQSSQGRAEVQTCIDLLTTNETYFFREPKHFEWLTQHLQSSAPADPGGWRVWSAACSTGEEAYSLAMVLADVCGQDVPWRILATDISSRVLGKARNGHYRMERAQSITQPYLKRYCLKGIGSQQGTLLVRRELRERVECLHLNLNERLPQLGKFDVIFLRNVMIYFDLPTKRAVVDRLIDCLRPGGYLCIGHAESLNDVTTRVRHISTAIYRKEEGMAR